MNWREAYRDRIVSADEAVRHISSGYRVVVGHACGEPVVLTDAMTAAAEEMDWKQVEVVHMIAMGKAGYCAPEMSDHFRHNSLFVGASTRDAIQTGRGDFTPVYFSRIPALFREAMHVNAALIQVSSPDQKGYCSFGISCDYTKAAAEAADIRIAQVNPRMPYIPGDNMIHISRLDYIVDQESPLIELPGAPLGEIQTRIGSYIASLVQDGDCLQLGIGAIPDAVLKALTGKKDLGIHSEMFSDGVMDLMEAGVITNARKQREVGCSVATFLMGTEKLYRFADRNPHVKMMPVEIVNNPYVIAQNDNVVSINSCVEVDLMGQVCAESVGLKQISGTGGQVDFVRGANLSRGGRTIMAMPSSAAGGTVSKIVPFLTKGAAVTTNRCDVDYVVTEYGIARLQGRTLRDRARQLIAIAAPQFREQLQMEYRSRFHEAV